MNRTGVEATFGGTDSTVNYAPTSAGEAPGDAPAEAEVRGQNSQVWLNI